MGQAHAQKLTAAQRQRYKIIPKYLTQLKDNTETCEGFLNAYDRAVNQGKAERASKMLIEVNNNIARLNSLLRLMSVTLPGEEMFSEAEA